MGSDGGTGQSEEEEVRAAAQGKFLRPVGLDSFLHPFLFRDQDALSSGGEGTPHVRDRRRGGQGDLPASASFLDSLSVTHPVCRVPYLG